ncbi:MAG: histidine phosphatase family protein [Pseudomonadota bacterium]
MNDDAGHTIYLLRHGETEWNTKRGAGGAI